MQISENYRFYSLLLNSAHVKRLGLIEEKKFQLLEGGYGHHPRPLSSNVKTVKEIQK